VLQPALPVRQDALAGGSPRVGSAGSGEPPVRAAPPLTRAVREHASRKLRSGTMLPSSGGAKELVALRLPPPLSQLAPRGDGAHPWRVRKPLALPAAPGLTLPTQCARPRHDRLPSRSAPLTALAAGHAAAAARSVARRA